MDSGRRAGHHIDFVINDQANGYPTRPVRTTASRADVEALTHQGYLVIPGLVDPADVVLLAESVSNLAESERADPAAEVLAGQNIYLRSLLDKDAAFHRLLAIEPALSIARLVLGPQVWVDLDGRMTFPGVPGVAVPWHIHMPVVPLPQPAFFCYPHQVHCLVYLDPVGDDEGPLCVLPGSHLEPDLRIPLNENADRCGQVELRFAPGDAVLIHGNLWHRVRATTPAAGPRRLLLLGYVPSWVRGDTGRGVRSDRRLTAELRQDADPATLELLGEFEW